MKRLSRIFLARARTDCYGECSQWSVCWYHFKRALLAVIAAHFIIDLIAIIVAALFLFGCEGILGPSRVEVLRDPNATYWAEAEYRIKYWLQWHPECSTRYVKPNISGVYGKDIATCEYDPNDRRIYVNNRPTIKTDVLVDGCMAHELGHAALHQAGNDCWDIFEHDLKEAP